MILHSRARNSINGTILRAKTGDDIVRMSVMMLNNNIFGPQPHLEDGNCTREMRVRSKDFFWWRERATFKEANRRIGWMWVRLKRLIWLHIFFGTSRCNLPRTFSFFSLTFSLFGGDFLVFPRSLLSHWPLGISDLLLWSRFKFTFCFFLFLLRMKCVI